MTIQRRLPKQADCLAAFLTTNRMIEVEEDSLLVPTADETAHQPQHRRPFSSPQPQQPAPDLAPDLPSRTLRRRNTFSNSSSSHGHGVRVGDDSSSSNGSGDGAVDDDSLANFLSLRTSTMLHEHEQEHQNMNRQNQNRLPSHHHGRTTLQPSPSCARAVLLNQESTSGAGGGGGGGGIPHFPLPFAVRPKNEQTQHQPSLTSSSSLTVSPPLCLSRDQQGFGATSASVRGKSASSC